MAVLTQYWPDLQEYLELKLSEPYLQDVVRGVSDSDLDIVLDVFPPYKIADMCRKKQRPMKHVWNESVFAIVTELKRIGYSGNKSYDETRDLLNLFYKQVIKKEFDRDLIRQRYTYHKRKITPTLGVCRSTYRLLE